LAISPCPNDTFIFDALVHHRIDTGGLHFNVQFFDIEQLNTLAIGQKFDVLKVSTGVLPLINNNYHVLDSGAALGNGCGPVLVSKVPYPAEREIVEGLKIAIPGEHTTAHHILSLAFPGIENKAFLVFSEIENAVLQGRVDAGLLIHENRFTYQGKGLHKICDLGEFWETTYQTPVPLGCIVAQRRLSEELKQKIEMLIRESVLYAFNNPDASEEFVRIHAQEMQPEVMKQHISLYVNEFSVSLGEQGRAAISVLARTTIA